LICSFNFLIFLAVCLNISTVINIKILTNSNQQTQSYKFTSHIAAFLSVILITEMLEICIQISHDQNVQLILKSYLPVVYGTTLKGCTKKMVTIRTGNWNSCDYLIFISSFNGCLIFHYEDYIYLHISCVKIRMFFSTGKVWRY
jgi:hypothetical protein